VGEVPVGCIFLYIPTMTVILRSHNLTNETKNATTHSEINCINFLYEFDESTLKDLCNEDKVINPSDVFKNSVLFVSCEPCVMCAYSLSLISNN